MASTQYDIKQITALDANTTTSDTDLYVLGNAGTATMRKITFATLASAILSRLTGTQTFSGLTTTSKYVIGAINELDADAGMTSMGITVGNGDIMTLSVNTSHKRNNELYLNLGIAFTGSRAAGLLLFRLSNSVTLRRTQYISVSKNGSATYMSSIAAGGGDCNCPVAFANGDTAYITGVLTLD